MEMTLLTWSANPLLSQTAAERLGVRACKRDLHRFPDGELHVEFRETGAKQA
jgi:phosphoribosylpyrophosphate synthetase